MVSRIFGAPKAGIILILSMAAVFSALLISLTGDNFAEVWMTDFYLKYTWLFFVAKIILIAAAIILTLLCGLFAYVWASKRGKYRPLKIIVSLISFFAILYFVVSISVLTNINNLTNILTLKRLTYDKELWIGAENSENGWRDRVRLRMLPDIVSKYSLIGMNKSQIENILGHTPYMHKECLIYLLGNEAGIFNIDSILLYIDFNEDGFVTKYRFVTD